MSRGSGRIGFYAWLRRDVHERRGQYVYIHLGHHTRSESLPPSCRKGTKPLSSHNVLAFFPPAVPLPRGSFVLPTARRKRSLVFQRVQSVKCPVCPTCPDTQKCPKCPGSIRFYPHCGLFLTDEASCCISVIKSLLPLCTALFVLRCPPASVIGSFSITASPDRVP